VEHTLSYWYAAGGDRGAHTKAEVFLESDLSTPIAATPFLLPGPYLSGPTRTPLVYNELTFTPTEGDIVVRFTENARSRHFAILDDVVLMVNNESPTITSDGGGDTANVNVAENEPIVTDVEGTDDSDAEGAGLVYSISGGADQSSFSIDANTGVLTFNTAPDFENPTDDGLDNVYDVQVTVTDSGLLTDVQDIAVTVTDVNETPVVANLIDDVMANEDQLDSVLDLANTFSDPDAGDTLTLIATSADNSLVTATMNGTNLILDYQLNGSGTTTVTVRATDQGGLFVEDTFTVNVASADSQLINLIGGVNALRDDGVLNNGNANALTSKLKNVQQKVNDGQINAAVNQLNAFRNQVEAFRKSGKLTDGQADDLIEKLEALLTSLLSG
jgi:hypothetical protein